MKKPLFLALVFAFTLLCVSCGDNASSNGPTDNSASSTPSASSSVESQSAFAAEADYEITNTSNRVWTDSIGSVWSQTIIEITNTGSKNLYLSTGAYDLEDANGNLVKSQSMASCYPNVLAPGEKGYIYDDVMLDNPVEGELTVLPRESVEEAKVDLIRFAPSEVKVSSDNYNQIKVMGRIENTTGEDQEDLIYIVAFLYDSNGQCLGQLFNILTEPFKAGDKIGFELSSLSIPDDITADMVADCVVYAYPDQMQF